VEKSMATSSVVEMPYATKLLADELQTFLNMGMRFLTSKGVQQLKMPRDLERPEGEAIGAALGAALGDVVFPEARIPEYREAPQEVEAAPEDLGALGLVGLGAEAEEAEEEEEEGAGGVEITVTTGLPAAAPGTTEAFLAAGYRGAPPLSGSTSTPSSPPYTSGNAGYAVEPDVLFLPATGQYVKARTGEVLSGYIPPWNRAAAAAAQSAQVGAYEVEPGVLYIPQAGQYVNAFTGGTLNGYVPPAERGRGNAGSSAAGGGPGGPGGPPIGPTNSANAYPYTPATPPEIVAQRMAQYAAEEAAAKAAAASQPGQRVLIGGAVQQLMPMSMPYMAQQPQAPILLGSGVPSGNPTVIIDTRNITMPPEYAQDEVNAAQGNPVMGSGGGGSRFARHRTPRARQMSPRRGNVSFGGGGGGGGEPSVSPGPGQKITIRKLG
jgi:hypothetical protein